MAPIEKLNGSERLTVPGHLLGDSTGDHYTLRVVGDELLTEGIMDRDYLIARRSSTPEDGEVAICLFGDDVTVRRFFHEGEHVRLESLAPGGTALHFPAHEVRVQGIAVGLMRRYRKEP